MKWYLSQNSFRDGPFRYCLVTSKDFYLVSRCLISIQSSILSVLQVSFAIFGRTQNVDNKIVELKLAFFFSIRPLTRCHFFLTQGNFLSNSANWGPILLNLKNKSASNSKVWRAWIWLPQVKIIQGAFSVHIRSRIVDFGTNLADGLTTSKNCLA